MSATTETRLKDLLADWAVGENLNPDELFELEGLKRLHPEIRPESFERAAAGVHQCWLAERLESLPMGLRARLERMRARLGSWGDAPRAKPGNPWRAGWWVAAAATIAMWLATRDALRPAPLPEARDWVAQSWTATADPDATGVTGEVRWSPSQNSGTMVFEGLPTNDPANAQYQLWIFDATRSADYPIDGGVFDAKEGRFEVPIDAKIVVDEAKLFAITLERPGGVVVSSRERLLLTAAF